jgi:excisionase family DNA binding protein
VTVEFYPSAMSNERDPASPSTTSKTSDNSGKCSPFSGRERSLDDLNDFLTRKQAAKLLRCSDQLISKLIKSKKLRAFKLGRKVIICRSDLLAVLKECL